MPAIDKDVACGRPLRSQGHACMVGPTSSQECSKRRACFGRGLHQAYHAPRTGNGLIEDLDNPQPADTKEDAQDTAQINRKRTRATMCCSTKCMQLQTTVTPVGAVMLRSARARAQVCYSIQCMQLQTTAMPVRAVVLINQGRSASVLLHPMYATAAQR